MDVFQKDLEFLEMFCNMEYLKWLYYHGWFEKSEFIDYLKKLLIFKEQKYFRFLVFPQSLEILEKILEDVKCLKNEEFYANIGKQQYFLWLNKK